MVCLEIQRTEYIYFYFNSYFNSELSRGWEVYIAFPGSLGYRLKSLDSSPFGGKANLNPDSLTTCSYSLQISARTNQEVQRLATRRGKKFSGCRLPLPYLKTLFLCRNKNDQSNNFDEDNHNDNEMVEIITMCCVWGSVCNSNKWAKNESWQIRWNGVSKKIKSVSCDSWWTSNLGFIYNKINKYL